MKKRIILLLSFVMSLNITNAQQTPYHSYLDQKEAARKQSVAEYLMLHPEAKYDYIDAKGNYLFMHHIATGNQPVYYQTRNNTGLAASIKTNKLHPSGGLSLSLTGSGMEVSASRARLGVWEPGPTRTSHQELTGRATTRDLPVFSTAGGNPDHATHVSGTMIASGVDANAKGMAYASKLDCYEIQSDEMTEMLTAAGEGMLVSNHSYGPSFSASNLTPNGAYTDECQQYDSISYLHNKYLQFHAAGNDRDEPNSIKYDILLGGCVAKNVATVGAVKILGSGGYTGPSSVEMSDFSCYGPTDDGRIKPDFVAPGVQIYSSISTSDAAYKLEDGTSMASPGAAASMFLLQQHYKNKKSTFMRASTLKGLGIHTSDECGTNPGPDYEFGWGLLNMEKAVGVLDNTGATHFYEESTLANSVPYKHKITTTGGPLRVTICWTDRPGVPVLPPTLNNRTAMLVNDLDLRITDFATGTPIATLPYKLDPNNPASAATLGDNTVDNVEQIYVASLPAGTYNIQVTHKGTLAGGTQEFAVFATGVSTVGINQFYVKSNTVKAYPNPFADVLMVEAKQGVQQVSVVNALGQVVANYNAGGTNTYTMNTSNWAKGVYMITVHAADGTGETVSVIK